MITKMYRVFDEKNNKPHTLFHGNNGSRCLPINEWVISDTKLVTDGSHGKSYMSGFHVLATSELVKSFFLRRFKILDNRVICAVDVDTDAGIWNKNEYVKLAKCIRITSEYWEERTRF